MRELNLENTGLSDRGIRALASSPLLREARELNVADNRFTDEGATALALSEHIRDDCRITVGWHPQWCSVTDLGLSALRERFLNLEVAKL